MHALCQPFSKMCFGVGFAFASVAVPSRGPIAIVPMLKADYCHSYQNTKTQHNEYDMKR